MEVILLERIEKLGQMGDVVKVKDGFAPQSKGPFTIMDNYGGMAKTTPGDNLQVGPGVGAKAAPQPIVVQNN